MRKDLNGFGKLLKELTYSKMISEKELAEKLCVNSTYISNMIANRASPSFQILNRINQEMNLTTAEADSLFIAAMDMKKEITLKTSDYLKLPEYNNFLESLKNLVCPYSSLVIEPEQKKLPSLIKEMEKVNNHKTNMIDIIRNCSQNILKITYYAKNQENGEIEINNVSGFVLFIDDYNNIVVFLDEFLGSEEKCSLTSNSFYWISLDFVISIEECDKQVSYLSINTSSFTLNKRSGDKVNYKFFLSLNDSKQFKIELTCSSSCKQKSSVENCQYQRV